MLLRQEQKEAEKRQRDKENEERKERQRRRVSELQLLREPRTATRLYHENAQGETSVTQPDQQLRANAALQPGPAVKKDKQAQVVSTSPSPAMQTQTAGLTRRGAGASVQTQNHRTWAGGAVAHGTRGSTAPRPPVTPPSTPLDFDSASVAEQARAAREALTAADAEARPEKLTDLDAAKVREQVRAARAALSQSSPPPQKTAFDATSVAQQARDAKAELGKKMAQEQGGKRWGEGKMAPPSQLAQNRREDLVDHKQENRPWGLAQALRLDPVTVEELFAVPCPSAAAPVTAAVAEARPGARARLAPAVRQEWEIKALSREEEARVYGAHVMALETTAVSALLSAPEGSRTVNPVPPLHLPLHLLGNLPVVAEGREVEEVSGGEGDAVASCEVLFEPEGAPAASPADNAVSGKDLAGEDLTFEEFYSQISRFQPT